MMATARERIEVNAGTDIDWTTLDDIVKRSAGWMRTSGRDGESAEVWIGDDKVYVFSGEGLIKFLYAIKDKYMEFAYDSVALCDYISGSKAQAPSVFVRDAIAARAEALKAKIEGKA